MYIRMHVSFSSLLEDNFKNLYISQRIQNVVVLLYVAIIFKRVQIIESNRLNALRVYLERHR